MRSDLDLGGSRRWYLSRCGSKMVGGKVKVVLDGSLKLPIWSWPRRDMCVELQGKQNCPVKVNGMWSSYDSMYDSMGWRTELSCHKIHGLE